MMRLQAELAIEEADVILFVVDGKQGIVPADEEVANICALVVTCSSCS